MSVINQMLRDLEQRKIKESVSDHYVDEVNIIAKSKIHPLWTILPMIIFLAIGVNVYLHFYKPINLTRNFKAMENKEMIPNRDFPILPKDISEINGQDGARINEAKTIDVVDTQELSKMAVDVKPTVETLVKPPVKQKAPKQPSVKIETFVKNENKQESKAKVKKAETSATQLKKVTVVKTIEKLFVENNSSESKATVKSPVKSVPIIISSEEVVYQAGQLMASNQSAALQLLKEKINLVSPDADYYSLMANLQQRRFEYDEAIISYRKALEIAPDKGELWIGIALAYRATGEERNAINAFKEALTSIEISPELKRYAEKQL